MTDTGFKYDVAFSFLDDDEPLARQIAGLLPNLSTFVFSERQAEIGATDGAVTFPAVFGREARIVVVLYREKWGKTKWTRIEETAIKDRVLNDGAEFLTFIHLEPPKPTPAWLPATRLWLDLDRLGVPGAASVIEERVRQAGGAVREETVEENAARLERELQEEKERAYFLGSESGVQAAQEAVDKLFERLEQLAPTASASFARVPTAVAMYRDGFTIEVAWSLEWRNTLDESALHVIEWKGRPDFGAHRYARTTEPRKLQAHQFHFDIVTAEDTGWRDAGTKRLYSTDRLADCCTNLLLERVRGSRLADP